MTVTAPAAVQAAAPAARPGGRLGTAHIVFLIVSAAAPLSAMVGTVPLAFAIGTGAAVPTAFLFAGATLLCFSVGYAVSARRTGGSGGFYAAIADGLGRPAAIGAGWLAVLAYNAATVGLVGALGYFTQLVLAAHGLDLPWQLCAAAGLLAVAALGYRDIAVSARLLAVLMVGEIGILAALDLAIAGRHGAAALPAAGISPSGALGAGAGVSLMFAFISFIGFESAALYGKEARDPGRSVPRATYVAVLLIAGFYALTSWEAVGAIGPDAVRDTAAAQQGDLLFGIGRDYLGGAGATTLQIMLCTSLFAATLALHSAANRYAQVLADDGLMPARLAALHRRHGSPHRASLAQSGLSAVVVAGFALAGLDPYADLTTSMLGLGTLGIVVLQAAAALAVLARARTGGAGWWQGVLAPLLGLLGLAATVVLVVGNFDLLTGSHHGLVSELPWAVPLVAGAGLLYALRMRATRPVRYRRIAAAHLPPRPRPRRTR
ncbi:MULTISPECIES: APC family permease [Kitasatospora]|uniref:Putative amino acid transporter n=1 Tax=Kitasatospora setae (strain ATCC 33774 / DSM 43861 / JCM 3304 / KCC A-0304 / NBRC 14216 / KM-6054) TaxID=452652 RepID=E4NBG2_KITSK|nr:MULTISPECIES: APC family permease [Kitasatospora]BAJ28543.1 putative amino acid transporter [Kitasatospora setae KM-6054]